MTDDSVLWKKADPRLLAREPVVLTGPASDPRGGLLPGPVLRVRIELDRTLRSRAFFARTVAGELTPPEYADLLWQLGTFSAVGSGRSAHRRLAAADVARVGARPAWRRRACVSVRLLGRALSSPQLPRAVTRRALDSVLTTSWLEDSLHALGPRFAGATRLLEAVRAGRSEPTGATSHDECLAGVTELCAGAWLGVAAYLDRRWPAPIAAVSFAMQRP